MWMAAAVTGRERQREQEDEEQETEIGGQQWFGV